MGPFVRDDLVFSSVFFDFLRFSPFFVQIDGPGAVSYFVVGSRPPPRYTAAMRNSENSTQDQTSPAPGSAGRSAAGSDVVYGVHATAELLRRRRDQVTALFIARSGDEERSGALAALVQEALGYGIKPIEKTRGELDQLAQGGVHQGVVALCGAYRYTASPLDFIDRARAAGTEPLIVILDGVTDPQNLGALVRSTHVLGGHGVVIPQDRAAGVTAATVKAAAGATELLGIAQVTNLVRAMDELREAGVWLAAAVAPGQDGRAPWAVDLTQPTGLVLGSEGKGLRPLVRKTCDLRIEIPMQYGLHGASLNVSAAGAVLLYESLRQRTGAVRGKTAAEPG